MVLSVAAWLTLAIIIAAVFPIYWLERTDDELINWGFLVFSAAALPASFIFTFPLNRLILVYNHESMPGREVYFSRMARIGKFFIKFRGLILVLFLLLLALAAYGIEQAKFRYWITINEGKANGLLSRNRLVRIRILFYILDNEICEAVPGIVYTIKNDEDIIVRDFAARILDKFPAKEYFNDLVTQFYKEENYWIRASILHTITAIDNMSALPVLINAMENDSDPAIRRISAMCLEDINDPASVKALIRTLNSKAPGTLKDIAADSLGYIGTDEAINTLIHAMKNGNSIVIKQTAIHGLGSGGENPRAMRALIAEFKTCKNATLQKSIIDALWCFELENKNVYDYVIWHCVNQNIEDYLMEQWESYEKYRKK
jgi:hypothetical protein